MEIFFRERKFVSNDWGIFFREEFVPHARREIERVREKKR